MAFSQLIRHEVRARFAPADAADIESLLWATQLPFLEQPAHHRDRDRVHLGILKQADGNFDRFARLLALASRDWRDLLVESGLANEDWPDVLRAAGYPVP